MLSTLTSTISSSSHKHLSLPAFCRWEIEVQRHEGIGQTSCKQLLVNQYTNPGLRAPSPVLFCASHFRTKGNMNIPTGTDLKFLYSFYRWYDEGKAQSFNEIHYYKTLIQPQIILNKEQRRDLGWPGPQCQGALGPAFFHHIFPQEKEPRNWTYAWKLGVLFSFILGDITCF